MGDGWARLHANGKESAERLAKWAEGPVVGIPEELGLGGRVGPGQEEGRFF